MRSFIALTGLLAATALAAPKPEGDGFIGQSTMQHGSDAKDLVIMFQKDENPNYKELLAQVGMGIDHKDFKRVWDNDVFAGMEIRAGNHCINALNAMKEVAYVEEKTVIQSFASKAGSPWGLQRISSDAGASGSPQGQGFTYSFADESLGAGVDIYVIDTGVRTSHAVFTGRATQGFSATGSPIDGDGHGTHCAGTAGGAKFGVAQGANIIAVKVLGDDGSGSSADTISGMDWVIQNHKKRKAQPGFVGSIMSMSWGLKGQTRSVDEVVQGASDLGIHVSVAAGNDGADACGSTPAHLGGSKSNIVTVGSINIKNSVSTFSNVGSCVDIFAPGEQILSAWNTGDTIINVLSGTSMATPHVTGVMAYLMAQDKSLGQNPKGLKAKLIEVSRKGKVVGNTKGTPNNMLSNGVNGAAARLVKNYVVPDRSGSAAARAAAAVAEDMVIDERFQLHSRDSPLRF